MSNEKKIKFTEMSYLLKTSYETNETSKNVS